MTRHPVLVLALVAACAPPGDDATSVEVEGFTVTLGEDGLEVRGPEGAVLADLGLALGWGGQQVTERLGAYLFEEVTTEVQAPDRLTLDAEASPPALTLHRGDEVLATVAIAADGPHALALTVQPGTVAGEGTPRLRLEAACEADETFMGAGSHAFDTVHTGEAFPLWVSEPGIGKDPTEDTPELWFQRGTRHASSYPVPFLLRAQQPGGVLLDTTARVELDLCSQGSDTWSATVWDHAPTLRLVDGTSALEVVEHLTALTGRPRGLPDWALMPWIDTFGDQDTLRATAAAVRDAGAPGSAIWTEDWKGAEANFTGYRLSESWTADRTLYPDIDTLADTLAADGWAWFAYFAPFVGLAHPVADDARAADVLVKQADGQEAVFVGANFQDASLVDLTRPVGRAWVLAKLQAAVDLGFRGWMADFAEWLPVDAVLDDGRDGLRAHNDYPRLWQELNEEVLAPVDGVSWCRSGWVGTSGTCPVVWLGDQSTDFDPGDGLPTILPLALGLSASGVPVTTHDVAGYQSFTTTTRDRELWFRWASLGAFSPILRTHHGSSAFDNHQVDEDADTLAYWATVAAEHARLWPYRAGLAARAAAEGTPMVLPTAFVVDGEPWDRIDAWMLGPALLVAPVVERGATSRQVDLPAGGWRDWWTLAPVQSGVFPAALDEIPVFVREGSLVPLFEDPPATLLPAPGATASPAAGLARRLLVVGRGADFTEADGTTYTVSGTPTGAATATATLQDGTLEAGGITVAVSGPTSRSYTLQVVP
ncbi:MAG: hypothetical protein H6732_14785 [Alphaproteobacteria bacterium]|nr:hypothetical protein [Alphaproteobacteria bacterium]